MGWLKQQSNTTLQCKQHIALHIKRMTSTCLNDYNLRRLHVTDYMVNSDMPIYKYVYKCTYKILDSMPHITPTRLCMYLMLRHLADIAISDLNPKESSVT